jgi:hypothetical protein
MGIYFWKKQSNRTLSGRWIKSDNENERETELYPSIGGKSKLRVVEVTLITIGLILICYSYWYSRVSNKDRDSVTEDSSVSK